MDRKQCRKTRHAIGKEDNVGWTILYKRPAFSYIGHNSVISNYILFAKVQKVDLCLNGKQNLILLWRGETQRFSVSGEGQTAQPSCKVKNGFDSSASSSSSAWTGI
jgi:hypothetical protein